MNPKKLKALVDRDSAKGSRSRRDDDAAEQEATGGMDAAKLARIVEEEGERVNAGKGDRELVAFVKKNYDPERNPPQWVTDEAKWERAKEAVDPEGDGADKYDEPYAVVAHVYKRMGGKIKQAKGGK